MWIANVLPRKSSRWLILAIRLLVWGYRPDLYVYTRMVSDSRFWDSQPLTGVPADRHLSATDVIYSRPAAKNRMELARSHPEFIVDGLSLLNPKLAPTAYPEPASVAEKLSPRCANETLSYLQKESSDNTPVRESLCLLLLHLRKRKGFLLPLGN